MKPTQAKDFWAGLLFLAFGLAFALGALHYDMGTAQRMGPAYFPTILGALLAIMGLYVASRAMRSRPTDGQVERFYFRPLLLVLGAVLLFAVMLRPLGLVVALSALIFVGSVGGPDFKFREVIVIIVVMVLLVLAVFIWALGLTIPVWPAFMDR
jgi:hypothetical protein